MRTIVRLVLLGSVLLVAGCGGGSNGDGPVSGGSNVEDPVNGGSNMEDPVDDGSNQGGGTPVNENFTLSVNAGPDMEIDEGADVVLNATVSMTPVREVTVTWSQISGFVIVVADTNPGILQFAAPLVDADIRLGFRVTVVDQQGQSSSDDIIVTVRDLPAEVSTGDSPYVVASVGSPAPGIEGATINSIKLHAIGPAGHIAFTGGYTLGTERGNAIWGGTPESVRLILATGDSVPGLPANLLFANTSFFDIASDGSIGMIIEFDGAQKGGAFAVWDGTATEIIIRSGQPAPGYAADVFLFGFTALDYSVAGAVFSASVNTFFQGAIWHWDRESVNLLAASGLGVDVPTQIPFRTGSGCDVFSAPVVSALDTILINDEGVIAFEGRLENSEDSDDCLGNAVLRLINNQFEIVVGDGAPLPGTENATFNVTHLSALTELGEIAIKAVLVDDTASGPDVGRLGNFIFPIDEAPKLVMLVEETIPPDYTDKYSALTNVPYVRSTNGGRSLVLSRTILGTSLLEGMPHANQPYSDIGAPGPTSLNLVASTNGAPPDGFAATAFYKSFAVPSMDKLGRVYFAGRLQDAADADFDVVAFFYAQSGQSPQMLFKVGDEVMVGQEKDSITGIILPEAQLFAVLLFDETGVPVSDEGAAFFEVRLNGNRSALLFVAPPQ